MHNNNKGIRHTTKAGVFRERAGEGLHRAGRVLVLLFSGKQTLFNGPPAPLDHPLTCSPSRKGPQRWPLLPFDPPGPMKARPRPWLSVSAAWVPEEERITQGNRPLLTSSPLGRASGRLVAVPSGACGWRRPPPHLLPAGSQAPTHSWRMSTTSVWFSKTSCSVMTLGCSTCRRMLTSRWISSRHTPRRLAQL